MKYHFTVLVLLSLFVSLSTSLAYNVITLGLPGHNNTNAALPPPTAPPPPAPPAPPPPPGPTPPPSPDICKNNLATCSNGCLSGNFSSCILSCAQAFCKCSNTSTNCQSYCNNGQGCPAGQYCITGYGGAQPPPGMPPPPPTYYCSSAAPDPSYCTITDPNKLCAICAFP